MNRLDHLLWVLAEECAEVAQRASKAARFGVAEVQPGQPLTNGQRIDVELNDLFAAVEMLKAAGAIVGEPDPLVVAAKVAKVEKFLAYSRQCGTLEGQP